MISMNKMKNLSDSKPHSVLFFAKDLYYFLTYLEETTLIDTHQMSLPSISWL